MRIRSVLLKVIFVVVFLTLFLGCSKRDEEAPKEANIVSEPNTDHIQKHPEEFATVAKLYQRLLDQSSGWVLQRQIRDDVTPAEKAIVLVSYKDKEEKVTVLDWLMALHSIRPPDRPRDLNTVKGVETFLDEYVLADNITFQQLIPEYTN